MPPRITIGDAQTKVTEDMADLYKKYDYRDRYPQGVDLRPDKDLHKNIASRLKWMIKDSRAAVQDRFDSFEQIDKTLTTYIDLSEQQKADFRKETYQKGKPIQIIVPMNYAILETLTTYLVAAFLEDPIFKYDWVGEEDMVGAVLLERIVEVQSRRSKVGLALHTQWRDSLSYGYGVVSPQWTSVTRPIVVKEPIYGKNWRGKNVQVGESEEVVDKVVVEGNELVNVNPRMYLPDPNVPIHQVQKGEYVGWLARTNMMDLLEEERYNRHYFNVQYLKGLGDTTSSFFKEVSGDAAAKTKRPEAAAKQKFWGAKPVDRAYVYVKLIPSDWGLGSGKYPEKWLFCLAADEIIIRAQTLGLDHGMFPVVVAAPDYDGYSVAPVSRLETTYQLQKTADWMLTSHVANVRKVINDMILYDPSLVNSYDMENPTPGMLVRMREMAWGRGLLDDAMKQFQVVDVTGRHMEDAERLMDYAYRYSGAVDSLQGVMRRGSERRSATEARDAYNSALSRLAKLAYIISMQSMVDVGYMFGWHTQQFMSKKQYVKVVDSLQKQLLQEAGVGMESDRVLISRDMLDIDFDVLPKDGTIPSGQNVEGLIQAFQVVAANPEVGAGLDMTRLFLHLMRVSGVRNVEQFRVKQRPQEQIEAQVGAGNYVPTGEAIEAGLFNRTA